MKKIRLMLFVLAFTAMTTGLASASEEAPGNPARGMIAHDDRDGDGKVSKDEFPGPDEHFTEIDLDGDGFINREEARQAPRPKGQSGRVPGKFQEDDADGDGVVSRTEFSGPADHFDRLDLDGDGVIQESEARQGPPIRVQKNR
jgi:Ca2+-binding EF-hand superfamily protein